MSYYNTQSSLDTCSPTFRRIIYPLENVSTCSQVRFVYPPPVTQEAEPAEQSGLAVKMNGGTDYFNYHDNSVPPTNLVTLVKLKQHTAPYHTFPPYN